MLLTLMMNLGMFTPPPPPSPSPIIQGGPGGYTGGTYRGDYDEDRIKQIDEQIKKRQAEEDQIILGIIQSAMKFLN